MDIEQAKKEIAKILKECGLMPVNSGKVVLNVSPNETISSIEVTATFR